MVLGDGPVGGIAAKLIFNRLVAQLFLCFLAYELAVEDIGVGSTFADAVESVSDGGFG